MSAAQRGSQHFTASFSYVYGNLFNVRLGSSETAELLTTSIT
jgi:hypothetical protein